MTKCFNTSELYITAAQEKDYSIEIGSLSFFSSSVMQKVHHLLVYHAIGIGFSLSIV